MHGRETRFVQACSRRRQMKETRCSAAFCFTGTTDTVFCFCLCLGEAKAKRPAAEVYAPGHSRGLARMCMPPKKAPPNLTEEAIRATKGGQLKVLPRLCNFAMRRHLSFQRGFWPCGQWLMCENLVEVGDDLHERSLPHDNTTGGQGQV
jgi:hypothetical protein